MRTLPPDLTPTACLLLSSSSAFADAAELSRGETTVTVGRNTITAHTEVK